MTPTTSEAVIVHELPYAFDDTTNFQSYHPRVCIIHSIPTALRVTKSHYQNWPLFKQIIFRHCAFLTLVTDTLFIFHSNKWRRYQYQFIQYSLKLIKAELRMYASVEISSVVQAITWGTGGSLSIWTPMNKFQWNCNRNSNFFIHENAFENVVCEMIAILSRLQSVCGIIWAVFYSEPPFTHDDVIKWKHFPRYWPFVRGTQRSRWSPAQRPVTRSFDVFFDLRSNKRLSKQWRGWWF